MGKKLFTLLVISSALIYMLLFFNNFNKSWAGDEEILATVNGQNITTTEFDELQKIFGIRESNKKEQEKFLTKIIAASLIAAKAKEIGLCEDPVIKQKVKAFREKQLFSAMGDRIREQIISDEKISKNPLPKYFEKKIRFREIVVQSMPEAEQIHKDILKGKDFERLAKEKSINRYAENGGDTGFVIMAGNKFSEKVEKIIAKLEDGQISEIIKTTEGYAIFKAIERKDLTDQEREKVITSIRRKLIREQAVTQVEKLRSQAEIKIFPENVEKILGIKNLKEAAQIELININGTIIRFLDVLSFLKHPLFDILRFSKYLNAPILKGLIENKIRQILIVNEAVRIGLDKDPKIKSLIKRFEQWQLSSKYVTDVLLKDVTCTEKEIKKFYKEYKDRPEYKKISECVHARQILVEHESIAEEILKQLKIGADFAETAQKHSILKIGEIGGDLGYLERGCSKTIKITPMNEDVEELIFGLSEGEISEIIKVNFDVYELYSIIKVEDRIKEGANDYSAIKGLMRRELLKKKEEEKHKDFIDRLMAKADIKKNLDLLKLTMENLPR